jgi:hypothetical protein
VPFKTWSGIKGNHVPINPEKGKREGKRNNKEKRKLKKEGG